MWQVEQSILKMLTLEISDAVFCNFKDAQKWHIERSCTVEGKLQS